MGANSKIEWTDATWNPVRGCSRVSPGCGGPGPHGGCYAEGMAARFSQEGQWGHGFAEMKGGAPRWTGKVELVEKMLTLPLRWEQPRKIFVNSTSDLFHEKLPDEAIDRVFAVMALCPQHAFQVLTKRPERMRAYVSDRDAASRVGTAMAEQWRAPLASGEWPLPNVWKGASVEDQERADERIPLLLQTPAAVRFISAEPLLGPIDLTRIDDGAAHREVPREHWGPLDDGENPPALWWNTLTGERTIMHGGSSGDWHRYDAKLDQVIVGGESGPNARPMHPQWARDLRDQCTAAGVAFFFKQWGEFAPTADVGFGDTPNAQTHVFKTGMVKGAPGSTMSTGIEVRRIGKKRAGRLLDGREHSAFPEAGR